MNIRVLAATIAGSITIFLLGYLIFGILLLPYTSADHIFEYLAGIRTFLGGMKVGAIIFFLITLSFDLSLLSIMNLHKGYTAYILDVGVKPSGRRLAAESSVRYWALWIRASDRHQLLTRRHWALTLRNTTRVRVVRLKRF